MTAATNLEQLYVELINDARLNPQQNAARYITSYSPLTSNDGDIQSALNFFGVNGPALQTAFNALIPAQPLAWNDALGTAARDHSQLMINQDQQSHQLPGEAALGTRITAAGYNGWSALAENIFAFSESALHGHAGFMVDWGSGPNGMQSPPGHRNNILSTTYREIGIGAIEENNGATSVGPQVLTEDFGARAGGPAVFILGATYTDTDANNFYSLGEGASGMSIAVGAASTSSAASGGYTLGLGAGTHAITFSSGLLAASLTFTTTLGSGANAKIDIVSGTTLKTSVSGTVAGPVTRIEALGTLGLSLTGDNDAETIVGGIGADTLMGAGGNDTLIGAGGNDSLTGGAGNNSLTGDAGTDVADYSAAPAGVTANLNSGSASNGYGGSDTLSSIEDLLGSASADVLIGSAQTNVLVGGTGSDYLLGLDGADRLEGGTGAANTLQGGNHDDTYIVSAVGDSVVEFVNEGTDVVETTLNSFYLYMANVENLRFTGAGVFIGLGNSHGNLIIGGSAGDTLLGLEGADTLHGGTGTPNTLQGGLGDDLYIVSATGDSVVEFANEGTDTVETALGVFNMYMPNVENLRYTGAGIFIGLGNTLANTLTGGVAGDTLLGLEGPDTLNGGTGTPNTLQGGPGDDRYVVSAVGDSVVEFTNEGTDTVETALGVFNMYMPNVENLTYVGGASFIGIGNTLSNVLTGGGGGDTLLGLEGADRLIGGTGMPNTLQGGPSNDVYVVSTIGDSIVEFAGEGADTIETTLAAFNMYMPNVENLTYVGSASFSGTGNALNNVLTGASQGDVLTGGGGNDTLNGGGGSDIAVYSSNRAAYTITGTANNATVSGAEGTDTLVNMETLVFADINVSLAALLGAAITDWRTIGSGDYDGNGFEDLLFQRANGEVAVTLLSANGSSSVILGTLDPHWRLIAASDFDTDQHTDLLWQDDHGELTARKMLGDSYLPASADTVPTQAILRGLAVHNNDGTDDIVWGTPASALEPWEIHGFIDARPAEASDDSTATPTLPADSALPLALDYAIVPAPAEWFLG